MELHPPFLVGRLVRLRAPEPADADTLNELFNDHAVRSGIGMPLPQPLESFQSWISSARSEPDHLNLTIERLDAEDAIGMCDLMKIEAATRTATLGIWIARPWWGAGYGPDAVRTLCRFGFDHMNLHRITLHVNADNEGAIRAYETSS
jgi:RimJ/RimL family protein N-acetyltransferase